jgi:hypothetical protein
LRNLTQALGALLAIVPAALWGGTASAAELIVNGGFEAPQIDASYATTTSLVGWTVDAGNVDIVQRPTYAAQTGTQALDLIGSGVSTGAISQAFATTIGQTYRLVFAYTKNTDTDAALSANVLVMGGLSLLSSAISHQGGTLDAPNWTIFSKTFVADSASTTLSFVDTSGRYNQGIFFDNVSVSSAVPEPATWALMILGIGVTGGVLRRRKTGAVFA